MNPKFKGLFLLSILIPLLLSNCGVLKKKTVKSSYSETAVLSHLNYNKQNDTIGFNMVAELPRIIYDHIMRGRIILWDSPKKKFQISPSGLMNLESGTNTSFRNTKNIFFNEIWSSTRKTTTFYVAGISFINHKKKEKIAYGYVDMQESMRILRNSFIKVNANGPAELSVWDAIYSRKYAFSIVQFGSNYFKENPVDAITIKEKAFNNKKTINNLYAIPNTKYIEYFILKDKENNDAIVNKLHRSIEDYLNKNKEEYFNLGGYKHYDFSRYRGYLSLSRIDVKERWTKQTNGIIVKKIEDITLYVNSRKLGPLSQEQIQEMSLLVNFKSPLDIMRSKEFKYVISKINNQYIYKKNSDAYIKALNTYAWSQLSQFVKYY